MKVAITHPIKQMIDSQYQFLASMLDRFPDLLDEWIRKQQKYVDEMAQSEANGDYEVYSSIYNSEISRVEPCYDEEQLFYQAMLIMICSYYESSLLRMAKENNIDKPRPSTIASKFGITLDGEYLRISKFLHCTIYPLRNQLCHNNSGTLFAKRDDQGEANIKKLAEQKIISIEEGKIIFIDKTFIKKTLEGEYKLLIKLADICGYKTTLYKT